MKNIFSKIQPRYKRRKLDLRLEPLECFKLIYPHFENLFFLESLGKENQLAGYSYIGFGPKIHLLADNGRLFVNQKVYKTADPYKLVESSFLKMRAFDPHPKKTRSKKVWERAKRGAGFTGGLVGYLGYEGGGFEFGLFLDGLIFDQLKNEVYYFSNDERIDRFETILNLLKEKTDFEADFSFRFLGVNKNKEEYTQMVRKAKKEIKKGNIFQVVLSLKFFYEVLGSKLLLYEALRKINPSPYMFYLKFGGRVLLGASPELLINVEKDKIKHFGTLAGTIKRGENLKEDHKLAQKMANDEKEKAEHLMLVDLARNDVGRVCRFGSIKVKNLLSIKRFSHVQHLSSEIYGELGPKENPFSSLSSCFPAGTLTGAPKIEAMKIISDLEKEPRGPYGGVVGYFSLNGEAMLAINIRSLYIKDKQAVAQVGSGIVYDSVPEKEYQEILNKGKAIREALFSASQ